VTTAAERLGASLTETTRFVHGAWRSSGAYAPLAADTRQWAEDITALVGYRPTPPVELGAEGAIGLGPMLGVPQFHHRIVVLVESAGYRVSAYRFGHVFEQAELLRRVTLTHIGQTMSELMIATACNRVHSHRQRLARWLLMTTEKAGQRSLPVTHETLAQMVGGPRHAVTVALSELRAEGAIVHLRGRVDILKRSVLVRQACECYTLAHIAQL